MFSFSLSLPSDLLNEINPVINECFQVLIHIQKHYVDNVRLMENCGIKDTHTISPDAVQALNVQNMSSLGIVYAVGMLLALGAVVMEFVIVTKQAHAARITYSS